MGISIDSIVTKWEKKLLQFNRLVRMDKFEINLLKEDVGIPYNSLRRDYGLLPNDSDKINDFSETYFNFYKRKSAQFSLEAVILPESSFKQWILKHKDAIFSFDTDCFYASYCREEYTRERWCAVERLPVKEDGKLLIMAIMNIEEYGITFDDALLSSDYLNDLGAGERMEEEVNRIINSDKIAIAEKAEKVLSTIARKEGDDFFEERLPRIHILIEALKKNGTFVYSV